MGKLAKALGFKPKGRIVLSVDKPSYTAGEVVTGTIFVEVFEPIQSNALVLGITGTEKMRWGTGEDAASHSPVFLQDKVVICSLPEEYLPGEYAYPFEYQLAATLPGVFHLDSFRSEQVLGDVSADVEYILTTTMDTKGAFAVDIVAKWSLVVHAQPAVAMATVGPLISTTDQKMTLFCCFNKGQCGLTIRLEKDVFQPGEIVYLDCDVDNRSKVAVATLRCNLYQEIHLTPKPGAKTETFSRKLCSQSFGCSVAARTRSSLEQSLPLVSEVYTARVMPPSTTGVLTRLSYRIGVTGRVSWGREIEIRVPVTIVAPVASVMPWNMPSVDAYMPFNV